MTIDALDTALSVAALLALAWWSSLQGLHCPSHELRIASGLGFYSVVSLGVIILNTHTLYGAEYHWTDKAQGFGYFCALPYWVLVFAKRTPKSLKICSQV